MSMVYLDIVSRELAFSLYAADTHEWPAVFTPQGKGGLHL